MTVGFLDLREVACKGVPEGCSGVKVLFSNIHTGVKIPLTIHQNNDLPDCMAVIKIFFGDNVSLCIPG